ncbi:hypothetical protein BST81_06015 [Leptolyngbya sp. 'hensonii']|uniref:NINE protein n=1 Tax=Leptolyngbya sp. 'hensonii' TaxID=1922337 RepID=UPI00094FA618|nr:NINE protein [Leptolyngbya sp. 'hensonii']OLP19310.1 hypothetical protein BST81_06015 [Leptolyngbya sp. 'hensonii']
MNPNPGIQPTSSPTPIKRIGNNLVTAYLLWAVYFIFPLAGGLHRLYNGQVFTGLLWMFTAGFCGLGQILDVFFIPGMVEDYNIKFRAKRGLLPDGTPMSVPAIDRPLTRDEKMVSLVKAASVRAGKLTVTQAVVDTGMSFSEAEGLLMEMTKSGYVEITNDAVTGIIVYDFKEL